MRQMSQRNGENKSPFSAKSNLGAPKKDRNGIGLIIRLLWKSKVQDCFFPAASIFFQSTECTKKSNYECQLIWSKTSILQAEKISVLILMFLSLDNLIICMLLLFIVWKWCFCSIAPFLNSSKKWQSKLASFSFSWPSQAQKPTNGKPLEVKKPSSCKWAVWLSHFPQANTVSTSAGVGTRTWISTGVTPPTSSGPTTRAQPGMGGPPTCPRTQTNTPSGTIARRPNQMILLWGKSSLASLDLWSVSR